MRRPGRMLCSLPLDAHRASVLRLMGTLADAKIWLASFSVIQSEARRGIGQRSVDDPLEPDPLEEPEPPPVGGAEASPDEEPDDLASALGVPLAVSDALEPVPPSDALSAAACPPVSPDAAAAPLDVAEALA